ncbi:adventurous gliding motility lipoprotein CglB [Archangium sp.]|uniref:adventurous gliding motility lipoprotein CglB n=1 Tax=Archangium sp. TaxID=1872627 RepID=UPI00389A5342
MRAKLTLVSALVLGTLGGVFATGCQTYDFEPVDPLAISQTTETRRIEARAAKPNLMLLVDTSGSMKDPVDPTDPDCKVSGVLCGDARPCNTTVCPTRWSELQAAMQDFLSTSGTVARMGLATYPDLKVDASCGATASLSVGLPAAGDDADATLAGNAEKVKNKILAIKNSSTTPGEQTPSGGTPTSLSLKYVGTLPELQTAERPDFVLLLTDGLPNCNGAYQPAYPDSGCFCTLSDCTYAKQIGCLDKNESVASVQALRGKEIKTIVVGFGADFNSTTTSGQQGASTLNQMADAGGFARECVADSDCGTGDTCDKTKSLCNRRFYQAANKAELVAALKKITEKVSTVDPCVVLFDADEAPSSQELVVVYLNGERVEPGADTWSLQGNVLTFTGSSCSRINGSTTANPVDIEVRAVQRR